MDGAMLPAAALVADSARSNLQLIDQENLETKDQENDSKKCEIPGCNNYFEYECMKKSECCTFGWKACGRKVCSEHITESLRCTSYPENECQRSYHKSQMKKVSIITFIVVMILVVAGIVFGVVLLPKM
jgi:hypothetical protein